MTKCTIHSDFFDETCEDCKKEYFELKGISRDAADTADGKDSTKKYKDFTEERAKQLYQDLLLQYLKSGYDEAESSKRAKSIIRKQCSIRNMPAWNWV